MKRYILSMLIFLNIIGNQTYIFGQITVENETITVDNIDGTNYTLSNNAELYVSNPSSSTTGIVNITADSGWLFLNGVRPSEAITNHLSYITINGQPSVYKTNIRVTNYLLGSVIMAHSSTFEALSVFKDDNYIGDEKKISPETYYKSFQLADFEDAISSFKLKRGYMATFAENEDGSGYSKVYISDRSDIEIATLSEELNNKVSFIRVFPWRYSTKKGIGSGADFNREARVAKELNASWYYDWRHEPTITNADDLLDIEYVPMKWNASVADLDTDTRWNDIANLTGVNHLLGFNEFDSASHANMDISEMIALWPKMMESGLRIGSPAPAGLSNGELIEFIRQCDELNYRVDFIAIHLYNRFENAQDFYDKVKYVYDNTGQRPIWITEFNHGGHWLSENPVISYEEMSNKIKSVIERLEQEGIVERYAIFSMEQDWVNKAIYLPPNETNYTDITPLGEVYRDQASTLAYDSERSNVSTKVNIALNKPVTASSHYSNYTPNFAVDGNAEDAVSRWLVRFNDNPLPAWLEVDLESPYTIDSYHMIEGGNSADFQLQYWDSDTSTWKIAETVTGNPDFNNYYGDSFDPFTTTKVKLYITEHNRADYLRMFEFELYGVDSTLSVNENETDEKISVFPNPTYGNVEIALNSTMQNVKVEVVNILGQTILSRHYHESVDKIRLDISNHISGMYFVIVESKNIQMFKVLKN